MNIQEMHMMFRQYAQQMGMQNIRAILPEQIDLLLNTSILDVTNQLVRSTVAVTNDRIITDNSKIAQINAFRTLYKVKEINIIPNLTFKSVSVNNGWTTFGYKICIKINTSYLIYKVPTITSTVEYNSFITKITNDIYALGYSYKEIKITGEYDYNDNDKQIYIALTTSDDSSIYELGIVGPNSDDDDDELKELVDSSAKSAESYVDKYFNFYKRNAYSGKLEGNGIGVDYLYAVDFSIRYKVVTKGYSATGINYTYDKDSFETNYFPVRLIDDAFLADTINDFQLAPKLRSPIIVSHDSVFDLYFPKFSQASDGSYLFHENLLPYVLRFAYIAKPATVLYDEDLTGKDVDCDLPDYLHVDIVKHAVELYMQAIGRGGPGNTIGSDTQTNTGESTTPQQKQ